MKTVNLTRVFVTDKKKDGTPLINKKGNPYKKVSVKTTDHGDKWLSGFAHDADDPMLSWKAGDQVTIVIEQNGDWLNFRHPVKQDVVNSRIDRLEGRVAALEMFMVENGKKEDPKEKEDQNFLDEVANEDLPEEPDEIPF